MHVQNIVLVWWMVFCYRCIRPDQPGRRSQKEGVLLGFDYLYVKCENQSEVQHGVVMSMLKFHVIYAINHDYEYRGSVLKSQ